METAMPRWCRLRLGFVLALPLALLSAPAIAETAGSRPAMLAAYKALGAALAVNSYGRPLRLESVQTSSSLRGEIYALIDHSYAQAASVLKEQAEWCGILSLHLNVKYCHPANTAGRSVLTLYLGRKYSQPLEDAHRLDFAYRAAADPEYLQVALEAELGPFGTRDYQIILEATPIDATHTLIRFSYSYAFGFAARIALQAYLTTFGSDKVGFTLTGTRSDGKPEYVDGVRGVLERNTMRYYLAIEAYLGALSLPAADRLEKRLNGWFDATERYPLQLHEVERGDYLQMKRAEFLRQRQLPSTPTTPSAPRT